MCKCMFHYDWRNIATVTFYDINTGHEINDLKVLSKPNIMEEYSNMYKVRDEVRAWGHPSDIRINLNKLLTGDK